MKVELEDEFWPEENHTEDLIDLSLAPEQHEIIKHEVLICNMASKCGSTPYQCHHKGHHITDGNCCKEDNCAETGWTVKCILTPKHVQVPESFIIPVLKIKTNPNVAFKLLSKKEKGIKIRKDVITDLECEWCHSKHTLVPMFDNDGEKYVKTDQVRCTRCGTTYNVNYLKERQIQF